MRSGIWSMCMYVVCMSMCMHVCMYVCIVCIGTAAWEYGVRSGIVYVYVYVYVYVHVYVYVYVYEYM